jgi:hypothetical protein
MGIVLAITPWPAISARHTAHQAIHITTVALSRGLCIATHSAGRGEAKERIVEREFVRVGQSVRKDLANYPALHRALSESIQRIEENHQNYVRDVPLDLKGFEVVALNVTKLRTDNFDPKEYMTRVDAWQAKVEQGGGRWRMINDLERLGGLL